MAAISVTDTPVEVPGVAGTNSEFLIQNLGPGAVYVGRAVTVTAATGIKLDPDAVLSTGDGITARNLTGLWLVCAATETADVRVLRVN